MTLLKRQKYSDEGRMRDCQQLGVEGEYYYKGTTQEFFFLGGVTKTILIVVEVTLIYTCVKFRRTVHQKC